MNTIRHATPSFALACAVFSACATGAPASRATRPRLSAIAPDSVQILAGNVTEVDLRGSGFDTSRSAPQNLVRVGSLVLRAVPSSVKGTVIRIAIPDAVPGGGEAPPAPWMSGRYPVTISTPNGTSDTLTLAIMTRGGRLP